MKKNKQDLVERHIYLEEWLKDNYPDNITDNEILSYFMNNFTNKHDILYLIEAYFLPKEDIEEYKENKFIGDIDVYRDLSIKYSVPVDCIIKRMNDIKLMNAESIGIYSTEIDNIKKLDEEFDCFDGNSIFKYIEIELLVEKLSISGLSKNEILKEVKKYNFGKTEMDYLNRAILLPRNEILREALKHENDEYIEYMKFVNALAVKYKTTSYDILDRIEEIMAINYLNGELEKDIKKKEKIKNSCIN